VLNKHLLRGDKLKDCTFKGFLLGYDALNIYQVWLPATNRVIRVRDVRFIDELYKDKPSTLHVRPHVVETAHIPEEEYDSDTIIVAQLLKQRQATITSSPTLKQIQQLPSPTTTTCGTPDRHGTPNRRDTTRRTSDRHSTPDRRDTTRSTPDRRSTLDRCSIPDPHDSAERQLF
jgi:hypothetical protein